jgi:hypothetical protein
VKGLSDIDLGEDLGLAGPLQDLINKQDWVLILLGDFIKLPIVYAES